MESIFTCSTGENLVIHKTEFDVSGVRTVIEPVISNMGC